MKKDKLFSPVKGGDYDGLTFKEWFLKLPRIGLGLFILMFIVVIQIANLYDEFPEFEGYLVATIVTSGIFIVYIIYVTSHWRVIKDTAMRTEGIRELYSDKNVTT